MWKKFTVHLLLKKFHLRGIIWFKEDHPSSYNIKDIFGAFTFNLHRKEVSRKRVRKVKQNDGTLEEMKEDEVLFKMKKKMMNIL